MKGISICWCYCMLLMILGCTKGDHPTPRTLSDKDTMVVDTSKSGNSGGNVSVNPLLPFCQSERFGAVSLYTEEQIETRSGTYTIRPTYQLQPQALQYTFRAPANDTLARRPFILMIHEGAFLFGNLGTEAGKARLMAQKGYAAASISYRLGFEGASQANACGGTNRGVVKALYRAVQDTRAALNYFVSNSTTFGIDPQQIYLAGSSAGSMTVTALKYMTEADFEKLVPGIVQELGPLNGAGKADYTIRGLLTYMGYAITDRNLITRTTVVPTLMFQGEQDSVLPYNSGSLFGCYLTTYGSFPVRQRLQELNQPYEWIVQRGGGHVTTYSTEFVTGRYAEFIKRIWCNDLRQISRTDSTITQNIQIKSPAGQK